MDTTQRGLCVGDILSREQGVGDWATSSCNTRSTIWIHKSTRIRHVNVGNRGNIFSLHVYVFTCGLTCGLIMLLCESGKLLTQKRRMWGLWIWLWKNLWRYVWPKMLLYWRCTGRCTWWRRGGAKGGGRWRRARGVVMRSRRKGRRWRRRWVRGEQGNWSRVW